MKRFLIYDKALHGGISYKLYTWEEVLHYFDAPEDITSIDELIDYVEHEDGHAIMYTIEPWDE